MLTVDDYMALPPGRPDLRAAYGEHADQFGELYLPAGAGLHPAIVLIHGGCWRAQYGLGPLGPLCEALRGAGYIVWSLEYRRLGGGGGWPATLADVAAGADALRDLGAPVDDGRVIAAGHSAGGHLALWLAGRPRLPGASALWAPNPLPLRGVLALAALGDLAEAARRGLCGTAVDELMGGAPGEAAGPYGEASPAALLPLGVPHAHLVGAHDTIVPPDYLETLVARARGAGDQATLSILPDAGHFDVIAPSGPAWEAVQEALRALRG
jgi:acetyl esterase/lipase